MEMPSLLRVKLKVDFEYTKGTACDRFHWWARSHNKPFVASFIIFYLIMLVWKGFQFYGPTNSAIGSNEVKFID